MAVVIAEMAAVLSVPKLTPQAPLVVDPAVAARVTTLEEVKDWIVVVS
jgi:hypothetical protein